MGRLLTDAQITAAVRRVTTGRAASVTLADAAPRGAGRLVLLVKQARPEWYAQRFVDGRRRLQKLGTYPEMSLAEARERFSAHRPAEGRATLGELFDAYLASLEGRSSHRQAGYILAEAGALIGRSRLARDVTPRDMVAVIKPRFDAGHRPAAAKRRMFLSAAFRWAIQSAHDYRSKNPRDWGLVVNPSTAVPVDKESGRVGSRWLSSEEFRTVLAWFTQEGAVGARAATGLLLLTGQRVTEIVGLRVEQWDSAEKILHFPKTKNGKPHTVPVCAQAARILDSLKPGPDGYFFPGKRGAITHDAVRAQIGRLAHEPSFDARDIRRTWKTLAGEAGLSTVQRDLLQNHGRGGIGAKHYDRWDAMPEKRAGVALWEAWLTAQT